MHKYLITRGIKKYVRRWVEDLETQFLPHPLKKKDGSILPINAQLVMRPIELWECVYPEESDDTVCKLLGTDSHNNLKGMHKLKKWLSRLIGLEMTEGKADLTNIVPQIPRPHVGVHILGNKEDMKDIHGNEML